jgi:hypothetical protein
MAEQDADRLKQIARAIIEAIKSIDSELLAYQMTLTALYQLRPEDAKFFEASLALAKLSDKYQTILRERYDSKLEQFLHKVSDEQTLVQAFEEWIQARKIDNAVN